MAGLDDDVKADERNDNRSDSDSDDMFSSRKTIHENGYEQPVETAYIENAVEELGQVRLCLIITLRCRFSVNFLSACLLLTMITFAGSDGGTVLMSDYTSV